MSNVKETKTDIMKRLFLDCNLANEDVHTHKHYKIITRAGIEKIQAAKDITVQFELVQMSADHTYCLIKAHGQMGDAKTETYGEAAPDNNRNAYPVAMAEKRALSRIVLKLAGLYSLGVMGEDESEDFKKSKAKPAPTKKALDSATFDKMLAAAKDAPDRVRAALPKYDMSTEQQALLQEALA